MKRARIAELVRALSSALSHSGLRGCLDNEECSHGLRPCILESVLTTLDSSYPIDDAVRSVWELAGVDPETFRPLREVFKGEFRAAFGPADCPITLEVAATALDAISSHICNQGRKTSNGTVSTPPELASFLVSETLDHADGWPEFSQLRIIDPSCGSGSLLLATLNEGRRKFEAAGHSPDEQKFTDWAIQHVSGVELDQDTAVAAATLLGLSLGLPAEEVIDAGIIQVADSLLDAGEAPDGPHYDAVIMNPPWLKLKHLRESDYSDRLRVHPSYPLTNGGGPGDLDLYQFFLERAFQITADGGRIGFIVPASFLRSSRARRLRHLYLTAGHLVRVDEFWNQGRIFPIHSMFRFVTGLFKKGSPPFPISARFRLASVEDACQQHSKQLSPDLFVDSNNGIARAIPEVVSSSALSIFRKISAAQPALGDPNNLWSAQIRFRRELDMTGDRHRFIDSDDVERQEVIDRSLRPVYEGRMVHQFDSAAKTYCGGKGRKAKWSVWLPGREFRPQFYVEDSLLPEGLAEDLRTYRAGYCDVTGHANERTILAAIVPAGAVCGNKVPTLQTKDPHLHHLWVAIANSFVVDWHLRRSVTTTINYHYLLALPFPWIPMNSPVGLSLLTLSKSLTAPPVYSPEHMWRRAHMRADIDCYVAAIFGLTVSDLNHIFDDFPLLDRAQPSAYREPSTITRDLVIAKFGRMTGNRNPKAEARLEAARQAGAIPYVPGELAAELIAANGQTRGGHGPPVAAA